MNKIIITLALTFSFGICFSQKSTFKVTKHLINGQDYSDDALEDDQVLNFTYNNELDVLLFINMSRLEGTYSGGDIYDFKKTEFAANEKTFAYDTYDFVWNFHNNYNDVDGKAKVSFTNIFISDQIVKFHCTIFVLDTNVLLEYEGYQED